MVPLARQFPGIVQVAQALPISFVKVFSPPMAKFSEFERVLYTIFPIPEIHNRHAALCAQSSRPTWQSREYR